MKNQFQIFNSPQFGAIRVMTNESNEPWFCLADVCKMLELSNPSQVKTRLNPRGMQLIDIQALISNDGVSISKLGNSLSNYINEANLYKCIFQSRIKEAETFQDWVTEEILPSIRKTGGYIIAKPEESPEEIMARALLVAQDTMDRQQKKIEEQAAKIEEDAPKVLFANAVLASANSCLVGELAKIITQNGHPIGQNQLFEWLRNKEYLGKHGECRNIPNQRYMELGLFELKKSVRTDNNGAMHSTITVKVTPKGQSYFINKFLNKEMRGRKKKLDSTSNT